MSDVLKPNGLPRREFLIQAAGVVSAVALLPTILPAAPRPREVLKVGIIGVGRQGRAIAVELGKLENVQVAAICDNDSARLKTAQGRTQGAEAIEDYRRLLEKADVGAVIIATPTHQHKEIALAAVQAGKHVYCECPLAHTPEDARAIALAARGSKKVFATALEGRSNPVYTLARSFFRSDAVRAVVSMRCHNHQKRSLRTPSSDPAREKALNWWLDKEISTGIPGEVGTQQLDVVHWYRDAYPVEVSGYTATRLWDDGRPAEIGDTCGCDFAFADGTRMQFEATLANSFEGKYELLAGVNSAIKLAWTHAWMFKEADANRQGWEVYANTQQFHKDEGITLIADATKLASQGKLQEGVGLPNPPTYYAISDFVRAVSEGKAPAAGADDAFRTTVVALAAHKAAAGKTQVEITAEMLKV
jgi:predicted dehydrogenase